MIDFLQNNAIAFMAAFSMVVTLYAFWKSLVPDNSVSKRLKEMSQRRTRLLDEQMSTKRKDKRAGLNKASSMGVIKATVHKMKLMGSEHADGLQLKLAQAGFRSRDAMMVFLFMMVFLPFVFGGLAAFVAYGMLAGKVTSIMQLLICVCGVCLGYYAPRIFVKNMKQRRCTEIRKGMPDSLDLLVICAQAGLSLDASLNRVSKEISFTCPELSDELSLAAVELGFLPNRADALHNLNNRVDLPQMRSLISTLVQTEKYGTPLSQSLRVLAQEYRDERMMRAEEKAARLPAILTLPMIIFILPPLFIVLLAPGLLRAIDSFSQM